MPLEAQLEYKLLFEEFRLRWKHSKKNFKFNLTQQPAVVAWLVEQ